MYQAEIQNGRIGVEPLLFTQFPVATMATTFSAKNSVTDSAAAGTALATGKKTYNHAISVGEDKNAIQTVAEKAKKAGKKVGVTTSVSVDHATPAAFYAHPVSYTHLSSFVRSRRSTQSKSVRVLSSFFNSSPRVLGLITVLPL